MQADDAPRLSEALIRSSATFMHAPCLQGLCSDEWFWSPTPDLQREIELLAASRPLLALKAEGEGFEPSSDPRARNGFRDRRIRPLCHPSEGRTGYPPSGDGDVELHAGRLVPRHAAIELVLPSLQRHFEFRRPGWWDQLGLVGLPFD